MSFCRALIREQSNISVGDNSAFCGEARSKIVQFSSQPSDTTKPHKMIKKFKIIATALRYSIHDIIAIANN